MVQRIYEVITNHPIVAAVTVFCAGLGFGLLTTTIVSISNKDCDLKERACAKGNLVPPKEAVLYKPFWISVNKTEGTAPFSADEVVLRTGGQAKTIIIDCETDEPFWWKPGKILELFLMMQGKLNETKLYLNVPQFWIRLAVSGQHGNENRYACVELIQYAVGNSLSNFQGVLLEADQVPSIYETHWGNEEYGWTNIDYWIQFGKYQVGLLYVGDSCNDDSKKIPDSLLHKFDRIFYLNDISEVNATEKVPVVSISKEYKDCYKKLKYEYNLSLVISDMANIHGYSDSPICILD